MTYNTASGSPFDDTDADEADSVEQAQLRDFAYRLIDENRQNAYYTEIAGVPAERQVEKLRIRLAALVRDAFIALGICPCCEGGGNHPNDESLVCPRCKGSGLP